MLMAGAGAPPCTTSIMWSVFEMWKLQERNSEYDYNLYVDIVGRNNHAKVIKLSQAHFRRLWPAKFEKKLAEDFEDERNEESGVD